MEQIEKSWDYFLEGQVFLKVFTWNAEMIFDREIERVNSAVEYAGKINYLRLVQKFAFREFYSETGNESVLWNCCLRLKVQFHIPLHTNLSLWKSRQIFNATCQEVESICLRSNF